LTILAKKMLPYSMYVTIMVKQLIILSKFISQKCILEKLLNIYTRIQN